MKKIFIMLNESEWRLVLHALNEFRTRLIAEGCYADLVNEVILKIIDAPVKILRTKG